jgi:hypothetical protein
VRALLLLLLLPCDIMLHACLRVPVNFIFLVTGAALTRMEIFR